jgi:ATP-binding cassette, subfamily B, bacterial
MSTTFAAELRSAGLRARTATLLLVHALGTAALLGSWVFIGRGALSGRLESGWIAAWALALFSATLLRAWAQGLARTAAIRFSALTRCRVLAAMDGVDPAAMRRTGTGALMSEVIDAESIDGEGGASFVQAVLAAVELAVAGIALGIGAATRLQLAVFALCLVALAGLFRRDLRLRSRLAARRRAQTGQLVEKMSAHRTRLAQQDPGEWHRDEDAQLQAYAADAFQLDGSTAFIAAALPRVYVIAALAALIPAFVSGSASFESLAITLGAVLYVFNVLGVLTSELPQAATAWIAWRALLPRLRGAASPAPGVTLRTHVAAGGGAGLRAQDLTFAHAGRPDFVITGASLDLRCGDRILLEGPSGSGKSTFAKLLAGLNPPATGFILSGGLDRHTLGDAGWRRQVVMAPQYHENFIFCAPLAFNLLLGRPQPHTETDLADAEAVCRELGLGELLERMPAGLEQFVGETGWRLSQGERSRVFLARAILQGAGTVILDESLAALDPENLQQGLRCAERRAPTLVVIAHP